MTAPTPPIFPARLDPTGSDSTVPGGLFDSPGSSYQPAPSVGQGLVAQGYANQDLGPLFDLPDDRSRCLAIAQLVKDQGRTRKRRRVEWECYKLWIRGVRGVYVKRNPEDRNQVELQIPLGAADLPPVLDRADELLEKFVAHLLSDPPVPDAEPASDEDDDRDAAEFTTRVLTSEGAESGYNNLGVVRRACRKAGVFGSGFVYAYVDPTGGGWQPMQVRCHPLAQTVDQALIDPQTGQRITSDVGLVTKYVAEDGSLTSQKGKAKRQWRPKVRCDVLTGEHVVLVPETCSGINDADAVVLIRWTPWSTLQSMFPDTLSGLTTDQIRMLAGWNPEGSEGTMPGFVQQARGGTPIGTTDSVPGSTLIPTLSYYQRSGGQYPKGCYMVAAHPEVAPILHAQPWCGMVEPSPGQLDEECLDLPIAQFRQLDDDLDDDPMGYGLIRKIGPADEVRGQIIMAFLEYLDQFLSPNTYIPMGSIIDADDFAARDGRVLYFNPQGKPEIEQVPAFPADGKEMLDRATNAQDSAVMLQETVQGGEVASVTSGAQVDAIAQLAHQNMATTRANTADGQERLWRIVAQLIRVFYTVPMQMQYEGEGGQYKAREWSRVDLGATRNIKIAAGSFTQQTPAAKQQQYDQRFQQQLIDKDEYDRLSASNISPLLGTQDNPHRVRAQRQVAAWNDGPPDDWQPPQAQRTVGPDGTPQIQPAQDPANPFLDVRPVDQEQQVAAIWWHELNRAMSGPAWLRFAQYPQWRQYLVDRYEQARQWAGIQTLAEQQQAQQAAQQAQMQAAQQQQTMQVQAQQAHEQARAQADQVRDQTKAQVDLLKTDRQEKGATERAAIQAATKQGPTVSAPVLPQPTSPFPPAA